MDTDKAIFLWTGGDVSAPSPWRRMFANARRALG